MAKNPLLNAASEVAQSVNLALSEGLTGVPFFQQHQERVNKRTEAAEGLAANRARLQAALGTGLISQSAVNAFPDGFEGMAKSKDFDKNLAQAMDAAAIARRDSKETVSDLEDANLVWAQSGVPSTTPKPEDAQGIRLVAAQYTRGKIETEAQKDLGNTHITGTLRTFDTYNALDNPTESDLTGLLGVYDGTVKRIAGLNIPDEDKKPMIRQAEVAYNLTKRNLEAKVKTSNIVGEVEGGDFTSLQTLNGAEFESVAKSSGVGVVVDKVDTSLQTLAPLAQDDKLMLELAKSDNPKIKEGVAVMGLLREGGAYTMQELLDDPELIKRVQGLDMNAILSETSRSNFNLSERDPAIKRLQQELDAPPKNIQDILYRGQEPDAAAFIQVGSKGPNEFEIQGVDAIYKPFLDAFNNDELTEAELRTIQTGLRYGGLSQSSPFLASLQPQIEAKLVRDVVEGFTLPQESADMDELDRLNGTEEQVSEMLTGALDEVILKASQLSSIEQNPIHSSGIPGQRSTARSEEQKKERQRLEHRLQKDTFVPAYANLTTAENTGTLQKTIETLTRAMNTDDPVLRAGIQNELELRNAELRNVRKRQVLGKPIQAIVGALASVGDGKSAGGYAALTDALAPYLVSTGGGGGLTSEATLSPSSQLIVDRIVEIETAKGPRRETLLTEIIDLAAPLIVASSADAQNAGLTVADFAGMWAEQMAIHDSGKMQIAAGQLSQGAWDTIPADGWDTTNTELNAWKIMHEMGRQQ